MRQLGCNAQESELPEIQANVDPENKGEFGLKNFVTFMNKKVMAVGTKEELKDAFDQFDRDNDTILTIDDMMNCAKFLDIKMPDDDQIWMFEHADLDKDGIITFDDFCVQFG